VSSITGLYAREILDSRGNPTIEAEVQLESGAVEKSREDARGFGDRAVKALEGLPEGEPRRQMRDLIEFVLSRDL